MKLFLLTLFLLSISLGQVSPYGKGMTWKVITWPTAANNNNGKIGCSSCDPYKGDTSCSESKKILCVKNHKTTPRTYYDYGSLTSPHAVNDNGFYNGWIGGSYGVTPFPFPGVALTSQGQASTYCQFFFGPNAKVA